MMRLPKKLWGFFHKKEKKASCNAPYHRFYGGSAEERLEALKKRPADSKKEH